MPKRTAAKKENSISIEKPEEAFGDVSKLGEDESDLSDSEESEYEGLEEEPSTSEDEQESNDEEDESDSEDELTVSWITKVNKEENGYTKTEDIKNEDGIPEEIDEDEKLRRLAKQIKPIQFEDADTSDEEDIRNTVGNIPMEWYNDFQHYGYSLDGKKLIKKVQGDKLDDFLKKMDDPDYWKTVYDKTNMEEIKLTDEEISIIQRIEGGQFPHQEYNPYEPYVDWFTGDKMIHPIKDNPESKRSFVPSKWEHKKIMKIVRAIRNGWLRPKKGPEDDKPKYYLLWGKDDVGKSHPMQWPAPKLKLPGHEESYNPPPEYLPTEEEKKLWEEQDPEERSTNFLPQRYDSLRKVPGYKNFINERFDRCLDLYLCARQRKQRINVDADDLIPELPRPRDLQPFPTVQSLVYKGHKGVVTSISCDPTGQWLVSGSLDNTIRLWEVTTCRCMQIIRVKGEVHNVQWNPQQNLPLFAAAVDNSLMFINPNLGDKLICKNVDKVIQDFVKEEEVASQGEVTWEEATANEKEMGIRLKVVHTKPIKQITWHKKGDYLATVSPEGVSKSIHIHQLSKRKSQCPFSKAKGLVQCVRFHPTRPFFFVATQRYVRVYNLQKQELSKKLMAGVKWISSIDIHPQGDNLIIGSYDKRTCWFDMDLSTKPYKILRHHKQAVRQVNYHNCYPLFASASDDGSVVVSHATVYNDLMQNPMIVPLKFLYGHSVVDGLGVVDLTFHPHQPWLFTCGADTTIRLFT